jgi:hypothetical protein
MFRGMTPQGASWCRDALGRNFTDLIGRVIRGTKNGSGLGSKFSTGIRQHGQHRTVGRSAETETANTTMFNVVSAV